MSEHTGTNECLEAHLEAEAEKWLALYRRRRRRQGDPLVRRRVRRTRDGREGTVINTLYYPAPQEQLRIAIDWDERQLGETRTSFGNENLLFCMVLDPPDLTGEAGVRIRTVVTRGTKGQVAERWAKLEPLDEERLEAGEHRYVEVDDQPMAYRRWRIVHISAPLTAAEVAEIPNEHPRAASLRRAAELAADDARDAAADWGMAA